MIAELRSLVTLDHEPIDSVRLEGESFAVQLRALIGAAGAPGEESFDFTVCSPAWLETEVEQYPVVSGRFLLIAREFHASRIEDYIRKRVAQASGDDWATVASKLARWSQWEFEDYEG